MKLKQRFGQKLINIGIGLAGATVKEELPVITHNFPQTSKANTGSAVVEITDELEQWAPDQAGNVIIVEPDIITRFRNQKHDM